MTEKEHIKEEDSHQEIEERKESSDTETSSDIENLKDEVAESYLLSLDAKKEGALGLVAGLGIAINPLHTLAKNYLLDKSQFLDPKKKKIFGKIKEVLLEKMKSENVVLPNDVSELFNVAYDKNALDKMRELLLQHKDNKQKLEEIRQQIEEGKDPFVSEVQQPVEPKKELVEDVKKQPENVQNIETSDRTSFLSPSVSHQTSLSSSSLGSKLLVGGTLVKIAQDEVDFIDKEMPLLLEKVDIKGEFADIEKIKYKRKPFLVCEGETPYVHKDILKDLLGFALLFFKKTGKPLTVSSAYRTNEHQERLVEQNSSSTTYMNAEGALVSGKVPTAEVGYSGHNQGLSLDIDKKLLDNLYKTDLKNLQGFQELAQKFHFNTINSEAWHFDHQLFTDQLQQEKQSPLLRDQRFAASQKLYEDFQYHWAA